MCNVPDNYTHYYECPECGNRVEETDYCSHCLSREELEKLCDTVVKFVSVRDEFRHLLRNTTNGKPWPAYEARLNGIRVGTIEKPGLLWHVYTRGNHIITDEFAEAKKIVRAKWEGNDGRGTMCKEMVTVNELQYYDAVILGSQMVPWDRCTANNHFEKMGYIKISEEHREDGSTVQVWKKRGKNE